MKIPKVSKNLAEIPEGLGLIKYIVQTFKKSKHYFSDQKIDIFWIYSVGQKKLEFFNCTLRNNQWHKLHKIYIF